MQECISAGQTEPSAVDQQQEEAGDEAHVVEAREVCDMVKHAMNGSRKHLGLGSSQDGPRDAGGAQAASNCALSSPSVSTDHLILEAGRLPTASLAQHVKPVAVVLCHPPAPAGLISSHMRVAPESPPTDARRHTMWSMVGDVWTRRESSTGREPCSAGKRLRIAFSK